MATYYIAPTGSDSTGNGTIGLPWASVSKFLALPPAAGDTLYCRGGTYPMTGNKNNIVYGVSGASGSPITIRAYPGEVPVFDDAQADAYFLIFTNSGASGGDQTGGTGCKYWVIDGLRLLNFFVGSGSALLFIGNWTDNDTVIHEYITIRNCYLDLHGATGGWGSHGIYLSGGSRNITIEDNIFSGTWVPAGSATGAGVHMYHPPSGQGMLIQRNIFIGWDEGIQLWDTATPATGGGSILHNSFLDCNYNIDARYHSTLLVRDNAGETGAAGNLNDPNHSASTTADHNFWGQTFDSNYYLDSGDSGWKAASDGLDAGALNYNPSAPGPATGLKHAFVSAWTDGGDSSKLQPSHWNAEHTIGECRILSGAGTPEGAVTAPVGSLFLRTDGSTSTTLYVKTSGTGNTGWTAK